MAGWSAILADMHDASRKASEVSIRRAAELQRVKTQQRSPSRQSEHPHLTRYTFLTVRSLAHLFRPERTALFLERLKSDPGICAAMRKHKFIVSLLTEIVPDKHTTSSPESGTTTRPLGLNRNVGEVIKLRLRTNARDGYRDYGTVRMCHELAHNVHMLHGPRLLGPEWPN